MPCSMVVVTSTQLLVGMLLQGSYAESLKGVV